MHVMVFATMSAGKSTFINSLIGSELLHSANEATTAAIASVASTRRMDEQSAACYAADLSLINQSARVCPQELKAWNADVNVQHIRVNVPFSGVYSRPDQLVLHDTPGPNNSQDGKHSELAFSALRNTNLHALCYVLNASQLGVNDDQRLLVQLREALKNKPGTRLIFALNKADLLDAERGESVEIMLAQAHAYLEANGFPQACLVPTMSWNALLVKKYLAGQSLTHFEEIHLRQKMERLQTPALSLPPTLGIPKEISRKTRDAMRRMAANARKSKHLPAHGSELAGLMSLLAQSGIPTMETLFRSRV